MIDWPASATTGLLGTYLQGEWIGFHVNSNGEPRKLGLALEGGATLGANL